jgi:hypothetical protein
MSNPPPRTGTEQFTGAFHPVTWSQERADDDLPPWVSDLDEQCFLDSEVIEDGQA